MDALWAVVVALVVLGIAVGSVGQVLVRGPADSGVPRRGLTLVVISGALLITALILALGRLVGVL